MTSTEVTNTTAMSKHKVSFNWKIKNWQDIKSFGREFRSEKFLLEKIDQLCYCYFNFDAHGKTGGKLPADCCLIGLCVNNQYRCELIPQIKVIKSSIIEDETAIGSFQIYENPSDYIDDETLISIMRISHDKISEGVTNDCLTILIEIEYVKFVNVSKPVKTCDYYRHYNICSHYNVLYEKQQLCDVTFIINDNKIKAHTFVLALASDYFLSMFTQDTKESKERIVDYSDDPDVSFQVFRCFLEFIYNIRQVNELQSVTCELLVLADKFDVKKLRACCEEYLANTIDDVNVGQLLILSSKHNCKFLKEKVLDYAKESPFALTESSEFVEICKDKKLVSEIIEHDA